MAVWAAYSAGQQATFSPYYTASSRGYRRPTPKEAVLSAVCISLGIFGNQQRPWGCSSSCGCSAAGGGGATRGGCPLEVRRNLYVAKSLRPTNSAGPDGAAPRHSAAEQEKDILRQSAHRKRHCAGASELRGALHASRCERVSRSPLPASQEQEQAREPGTARNQLLQSLDGPASIHQQHQGHGQLLRSGCNQHSTHHPPSPV